MLTVIGQGPGRGENSSALTIDRSSTATAAAEGTTLQDQARPADPRSEKCSISTQDCRTALNPSRSGRPASPNRLRHAHSATSDARQRPDRAETLNRAPQHPKERDDASHPSRSGPGDRQGGDLKGRGPAQTGSSRQKRRPDHTEREPLTKRQQVPESGIDQDRSRASEGSLRLPGGTDPPQGQGTEPTALPVHPLTLRHQKGRLKSPGPQGSARKTDLT